ncbi:RNA-directed DNA polymerase [Pseudoxanthomonas sp. PXM03]|uniref:antiviral reverse transcriptase Drt3b n=1 Tax=Pseudoxanthomonas sp. PXM03 TaxID=2769284 RepID=UPI001783C40E|nr:antiviral reverse transcriptase Drt3b [Pseudoxanthomonas sp. PXM03]MBD9437132.1 RNA-directed DNA polymerase [Pseudoxanthomonas sp. PXM03]
MSSKKRIDIKAAERALLTDTLPFELPLYFTNANLAIIAFGLRKARPGSKLHERLLLWPIGEAKSPKPTRPFKFDIKRDGGSERRLSLAHPRSQHRISLLYLEYDSFISNVCNRSSISLRHPSRVATHYVDPRYAERAPKDTRAADEDPVGFRDQSKWASTYFSYRDYSLAHKFFESDEFLELERRYSYLLKLDVARCFESLYTHSIEWAMRGKQFSKEHLSRQNHTFESSFDAAIRHGNWDETHGILVGPESSRIFAEIVLQSADRAISSGVPASLGSHVIRRYVDDYYVFANEVSDLDFVEDLIRKSLLELNLHLNDKKREVLRRPFVSSVSVARHEVARAIDEFFEKTSFVLEVDHGLDLRAIGRSHNALISRVRRLSVELDLPYERVASFALTVVKRKLGEVSLRLGEEKRAFKGGSVGRLSWLTAILRIAQFLYSTDRRANTSLKLAAIYSISIGLASTLDCARAPLERQILDGLRDDSMGSLASGADEVTRINHICAVDLLLTEDRRIDVDDIDSYLGSSSSKDLESFSAFSLIAALFLCRRRARFDQLKLRVIMEIERRILSKGFHPMIDAADAILLTDFISCPYVDVTSKLGVIKHSHKLILGMNCTNAEATKIAESYAWISFADWGGVTDLSQMLARRELTPAYE